MYLLVLHMFNECLIETVIFTHCLFLWLKILIMLCYLKELLFMIACSACQFHLSSILSVAHAPECCKTRWNSIRGLKCTWFLCASVGSRISAARVLLPVDFREWWMKHFVFCNFIFIFSLEKIIYFINLFFPEVRKNTWI